MLSLMIWIGTVNLTVLLRDAGYFNSANTQIEIDLTMLICASRRAFTRCPFLTNSYVRSSSFCICGRPFITPCPEKYFQNVNNLTVVLLAKSDRLTRRLKRH